MFAQALARRLKRAGIHYGWAIVAIVFLLALTAQGCMGISGALIIPLTKEFGWSAEQISVALALRIVLFGLMAPFTAALIDKYGFKYVLLVALSLIEIGLIGTLVMTRLWQLVLFWGVIVGFGTGLAAMVLVALVAARWFTARRGLAAGILSASIASGQLVFLPLAAWLAERFGWRLALGPPTLALLLVAILVVLFLVDKPEDVGLKPYGDKGDTPAHVAPAAAFSRVFEVLYDSIRSSAFWVLAGTFFVCGLSTNGLVQTHFISLCSDYGVPAVANFATYLPAFYGAGLACLVAAAAVWLIGRRQSARERLIEARA